MPRGGHSGHGGHRGRGGRGHRRHYGHHGRYVFGGGYPRVYATYASAWPYAYGLWPAAYPAYYSPVRTAYGSCDCNLNGYVTNNNCTQGVPVCTSGNCTCYNQASQTTGCFNQRGAIC